MELKKQMQISMLLTLAVVISIVESFFPVFNNLIPGFKLGLANAVVLFALFVFSFKEAFYISFLKVLLVGILRTGLFSITFFFSLSGAVLSILMMGTFKKIDKFSIIGISIVGAVFHGIGQIVFATFYMESYKILNILPLIILISIPSGIVVGILSKKIILHYREDFA